MAHELEGLGLGGTPLAFPLLGQLSGACCGNGERELEESVWLRAGLGVASEGPTCS